MTEMWESPNQSDPRDDGSLANGRKLSAQAKQWMDAHHDEFMLIYTYVKSLQERGQRGRIRDRVALFCCENGITVGSGKSHMFANAVWAGVARYMAHMDPSLVGNPLEFSYSDIDCSGLYPVEWMEG